MSRPAHVILENIDLDADGNLDDATNFTGNPIFSGNPVFSGTLDISSATFSGDPTFTNLNLTDTTPLITLTESASSRTLTLERQVAGSLISTSQGPLTFAPATSYIGVRASGGTANVDDTRIIHDGTDGFAQAMSGSMVIENGAGDEQLRYVDVPVSSAEILALNGTPKTLVAAPGANKVLVFKKAVFFLDYNSTAYDGVAAGENLTIRYIDGSGTVVGFVETTGFIDQTNDEYAVTYVATSETATTASFNATQEVNQPLVLAIDAGEIATGNSPMGVRVYYDILDLSTLSAT